MVAYQTVVATLNAQVQQEAWTQAGDAPGCVDQPSVRDSAHRIATEPDPIPHLSSADRSDNSDPRRQHLRARSINPVMTPGVVLNTAAVWAAARLEKHGPRGTRAGNLPREAGISRTAANEIDSVAKETL